jgi:hypothetical protein
MDAGIIPFSRSGYVYLFEAKDLDAWNARRIAGEFGKPGPRKNEVVKP